MAKKDKKDNKRRYTPPEFPKFKLETPDYKKPAFLRKFMTQRGKILPASRTNVSATFQRLLRREIIRARTLGYLPFIEGKDK